LSVGKKNSLYCQLQEEITLHGLAWLGREEFGLGKIACCCPRIKLAVREGEKGKRRKEKRKEEREGNKERNRKLEIFQTQNF
jgi:hypothetical protein